MDGLRALNRLAPSIGLLATISRCRPRAICRPGGTHTTRLTESRFWPTLPDHIRSDVRILRSGNHHHYLSGTTEESVDRASGRPRSAAGAGLTTTISRQALDVRFRRSGPVAFTEPVCEIMASLMPTSIVTGYLLFLEYVSWCCSLTLCPIGPHEPAKTPTLHTRRDEAQALRRQVATCEERIRDQWMRK